ncbi:MAG: hypothetical protein U0892_20200 [Pirellulales bacterium]
MAPKKRFRFPKTLEKRLEDLDHHLYLLRLGIRGLTNDPAHIKSIAAELRTLVCYSSDTEGLLWRLIDEYKLSDKVFIEAQKDIPVRSPLHRGLRFAQARLNRPHDSPPGCPPRSHSLRHVVKSYESLYVATIDARRITNEMLIKCVAEQMGSSHEDDGLDPFLHRLTNFIVNDSEPYLEPLRFIAELTLQVGERVLDAAETLGHYGRMIRGDLIGDFSLIVQIIKTEPIVGRIDVCRLEADISGVVILCRATPMSFYFKLYQDGKHIADYVLPFEEIGQVTLFTWSYSSRMRRSKHYKNSTAHVEQSCGIGFLDTYDLRHIPLISDSHPSLQIAWIRWDNKLFSTSELSSFVGMDRRTAISNHMARSPYFAFPD